MNESAFMNKLIEYFLTNSRLNHTILAFIVVMGIFAYRSIPKEMFPTVTLESIQITGSYQGASASSLNNFAVTEIENELDSISGIKKVTSTLTDGSFSIKVELQEGQDKASILNEVKDAISTAKKYFPSDMTEPTATSQKRQGSLMHVSLSSASLEKQGLLEASKKLKTAIMQVENISDVEVYGDTDLHILIMLDHKKIAMHQLDSAEVISAIEALSYMYPVASIEEAGNHVYVNADNNKFDVAAWRGTLLSVSGKKVYLGDIATVVIDYPIDETIARLNGNATIALQIYKDDKGDSLRVAKEVKSVFARFEASQESVSLSISRDSSEPIQERIATITSNITLGLILVGLSMYFLVSPRLSLVIVLGIPFSFILGLLVIETLGYSLNMISMMAMLISLGIVVDDAIIVSENIQRHLDEGRPIREAVLTGTKEMIAPVLIAALTTIFAFLPMLLISGEMGLLVQLVPIVVSVLIVASLVESFLFLPLHAQHLLKPREKMLDWTPLYNLYERVLRRIIVHKKSFLFLFFVTIPLLTALLLWQSRFQMFPEMDSQNVTVSVKLDDSTALAETDKIAKQFERVLLENAAALFIKNINTTVGRYTDLSSTSQTLENGLTLALELEEFREENILENYINPLLSLSFDFKREDKTRREDTATVVQRIRSQLAPLLREEKVVDSNIVAQTIGIINTDIELKLSATNTQSLLEGIDALKKALEDIEGIRDVSDNTQLGQQEYKYTVNAYGRTLGLSDAGLASMLGSYFMEKEQANTFNEEGIVKIKTQSLYKDNLDAFKAFLVPLEDGRYVALKEVVDFRIERNFERLEKEDGVLYKKVFANVESAQLTANEALKKLSPTLALVKDQGVDVRFGGEREKSAQMASDMVKAFVVAMFLIFITLLINFPSFKSALMLLSVIPFTIVGPLAGHFLMGIDINSQSMIGMLGLAGVVINDGIIMLDFLHATRTKETFFKRAKQRVRPILITSITTMLGLSTLIFFPSGESVMLQPIAVSLGFGIAWGTVLNLVYIPALYATLFKIKE